MQFVITFVLVMLTFVPRPALADTTLTLFNSFAGRLNFVGTQKTLRTQPDTGNSCAIDTGTTTAALSGLPAGHTVRAAYLYWAGSAAPGSEDYTITFEGNTLTSTAARSYTATFNFGGTNFDYFSGAIDVTATVAAKGNGTYSFANLTVNNGNPWCGSSAVLGGWALLVIYSHPSEDFRVVNVYEGFQHFRGSAITLTPSNFLVPASPKNGRNAHLTWEGDVGNSASLGGFNEQLTFNGNILTDANNPANNQFNSVSSINTPVDTNSYGVDFDVFDIGAYLTAGDTSATTIYSSGGDLVLLSAQIISTTNVDVADLEVTKTRNGNLVPGQNATYSLSVINHGPRDESGPVTVVDTLPAGLSYVSGTGTSWSCSAAGQVVTCNYSGALSVGVTTPTLTLTVAVSPTASGTTTNSATVSGQEFDNISWNNTATDSFYILTAAYAYYAMDEASWGTVADSSGNGRDASVLGAAAPTGYPPASPPGSAIAGNPGTCGSGHVPVTAGTQGVSTPIDPDNHLGNAGTIAFWYNSNTTWNDGNDRMLFDASNELGNNAADKHFYLVKGDTGRLRFAFENSGDTDYEARDPTNRNFAAGTWHHIAVTWNVGSDVARLYLNGTQVATSANTAGVLGNTATLYLGDQRNGVGGTPGDFTTNSANGYIDEVRIYATALSAADVVRVRDLTHTCGTPLHHIRIEHGSGSGLTCNPSTVTVRACADATCSSAYTSGVTGSLTATGTPTVNWVGTSNFTIASGASTVTKDFQVTTPGTVVLGTSGVNPAPTGTSPVCDFGSPSCTFTAADSGFVFDVPNHVADTTQNVTLAAVRKDDVTQKCVPAFQSVSRTVNFWSSYINPNSGTLALNLNAGNISGSSPGTGVSLNFNANGEATLQVRYPDVGEMRLNASYSGSGTSAGLTMTGLDNFVTKPSRFVLGIAGNPGAANATGSVFKRAGEGFPITVEARNASDAITPNYGRESTAETVKLTTALVGPTLGNGGVNVALGGSFGNFGLDCSGNPGTAGTACGTFNWPEVGIMTLTPSIGDDDYLGAGNVTATATGNIGRFVPDHFAFIAAPVLTNRSNLTCSPSSSFTYLAEPFRLTFQLEAQNATNGRTQNYLPNALAADNYAKLDVTSGGVFGALTGNGTLNTRLSTAAIAGNTWQTGANAGRTNSIAVDVTVARKAGGGDPDGAFNNTEVGLAPTDTDGVTLVAAEFNRDWEAPAGNDHRFVDTTHLRYGRLYLQNGYGSELLTVPYPIGGSPVLMQAQYYVDADTAFMRHTDDSCTAVALTQLTLTNTIETQPGNQPIKVNGTITTTANLATVKFTSGNAGLYFSAPGAGGDGYVDFRAAVSSHPGLRYDWDGDSDFNEASGDDPQGRVTFGLYRGSPRHIYQRERY